MKHRRGFTLIELLVVIAIIALLMAILMPALQRVKKQAKGVICQSNLKQWGTIWSMYADDNNGMFPKRTSSSGRWIDALFDYYYRDDQFRCCPVATKIAFPQYPPGASGTLVIGGDAVTSWGRLTESAGRPAGTWGSYGVNGWVYVCGQDELYGKPAKDFWKSPNVNGASQVPLFLDCWFWCGWPEHTDTPPNYDGERWAGDVDSMQRFAINRHEQAINAIFLDYSIRKVGLKQLWTLKWSRGFNTAGIWTRAGGVRSEDWPQWMRSFQDY